MNMPTTSHRKPSLLVLLTFMVGVLASAAVQAGDLQTWKPELSLDDGGKGLNLAKPFGAHGPTLRLSNAIPDEVKRCLRAGGDHQIGALAADNPDAYLYLEKRW